MCMRGINTISFKLRAIIVRVPGFTFLNCIYLGLRMQGVSRLPNSTLFVVEPGYLGLSVQFVSYTETSLLIANN